MVREQYRNTVEGEVLRAKLAGCLVVVAEDANAKLGPTMIKDDPHPMSENGRLLKNMIERQGLVVINSSAKCTGGPITRKRMVDGRMEESCIDFILASPELEMCLVEATIDSNQIFALTKYTNTKGRTNVKKSDHYSMIAKFELIK